MRLLAVAAVFALAPLAHAQSLGELSAAMGVHNAAAGAGMSSASIAHRARDTVTSHLSTTGNGWQPASRSGAHSSGNGWATSAGSSVRGVRTSAGWATASAAGRSSGGGWVKRDSPSQRRR